MPMLIRAVQITDGAVMELGAGIFSTPLLHWLCAGDGRSLVTYEKDPKYYGFARKFMSRTHRICLVDDWDKIDIKTHWSVVLIDQDNKRGETALLLKDSADYIILHDSEEEKLYGYDKIWEHFKYRYDWKECSPWTTVVSNFKDLSDMRKN